jgi:hypothetical protein
VGPIGVGVGVGVGVGSSHHHVKTIYGHLALVFNMYKDVLAILYDGH